MGVPVAASRRCTQYQVPIDHVDRAQNIVDNLNETLVRAHAMFKWAEDGETKKPVIIVIGDSNTDLKDARTTIMLRGLIPWLLERPLDPSRLGEMAVEYRIPPCHQSHMDLVVANLNLAILPARARIEPGQDGQYRLKIEADTPWALKNARYTAREQHFIPWLL